MLRTKNCTVGIAILAVAQKLRQDFLKDRDATPWHYKFAKRRKKGPAFDPVLPVV